MLEQELGARPSQLLVAMREIQQEERHAPLGPHRSETQHVLLAAAGFARERAHQQVLRVGGLPRPLLALRKREDEDFGLHQRDDVRLVETGVDSVEPDDVAGDLEPRDLDQAIAGHHETLEIADVHNVQRPECLAGGTQGLAPADVPARTWVWVLKGELGMQDTGLCLFDAIAE